MPFQQKSAIAMAVALATVYGGYFALVSVWLANAPVDEIVYQPLLIVAIAPLAILAAVSHVALAVASPKEANAYDERDRLISRRGDQIGGYVLAVGVFAGLVLAMVEASPFYIAHALLLAWVVAEVGGEATRIVLYRRGT